jgi:hypothetical protein
MDIWKIPFMIQDLNSQYQFILRHHTLTPNETVLYALPQNQSPYIPNRKLSDEIKAVCYEALYTIRTNARVIDEGQRKSEMLYSLQQSSNYHAALDEANHTLLQMQEQMKPQNKAKIYYEEQMKGYEELKNWAAELAKSKTYYEEQMKGYEELKRWTTELVEAKLYYEEQMRGFEELKRWTAELTEAKAFLEQEIANRDAIIDEMKAQKPGNESTSG